MMKITQFLLILVLSLLVSCTEDVQKKEFNAFLTEPCMLVNYEQDNSIEGHYLTVNSVRKKDSLITIDLPVDFYVNNSNISNWVIGWGTNRPLFDAGVENIREILNIEKDHRTIHIGRISNSKPKNCFLE